MPAEREVLNATGFLDLSALKLPGLPPVHEVPAPDMRVGTYTVEAQLGHGGMGEVWLVNGKGQQEIVRREAQPRSR